MPIGMLRFFIIPIWSLGFSRFRANAKLKTSVFTKMQQTIWEKHRKKMLLYGKGYKWLKMVHD